MHESATAIAPGTGSSYDVQTARSVGFYPPWFLSSYRLFSMCTLAACPKFPNHSIYMARFDADGSVTASSSSHQRGCYIAVDIFVAHGIVASFALLKSPTSSADVEFPKGGVFPVLVARAVGKLRAAAPSRFPTGKGR